MSVTGLAVIVFDVNETLVDLEPLRARFEEVGAAGYLLETWFASVLRDGIGLAAAGAYADFQTVATGVLHGLLTGGEGVEGDPREAAEHVVAGFGELPLHADVEPGMRKLHEAGLRLLTLTNGSAELSERVLACAGVARLVERFLSVREVGRWKPAPEPYLYAVRECREPANRVALVAVHPWDVDGATRAGLRGAWLDRENLPYPSFLEPPEATGPDLSALAETLLSLT